MHQVRSSKLSQFHDKEPVLHITNPVWTWREHKLHICSVLPNAPGFLCVRNRVIPVAQLLRPAFKMVPGRQWCTCSLGYMLIYWQSESPETSWESPRLCRWEIMDGMFWLLRCETRLFCSNGVECSLRAEPRRPCLVILPGGIYS